jgi:transposase
MPAPLRITLTLEQERTLKELRVAPKISQRTKDRAQVLLANANGCNAPVIAKFMGCREHTVHETIRRWKVFGLGGLWDAERCGSKSRWTEEDMTYLEQCLAEEQRTYNSHQLAQKLEKERGVHLSAQQIRKVLKKRAGDGKEPGIAKNGSKTPSKKP